MSRGPDSTLPSHRLPALVLISPGEALLAACYELARTLEEAPVVKATDVKTASTMVAEWRPFAIIVPEAVFQFDPREFESLAQAVGAEVMAIAGDETQTELVARLAPRLKASFEWWQARQAVAP